jgi:hypothetical protein
MSAWRQFPVANFLPMNPEDVAASLAFVQSQRYRGTEPAQTAAWIEQVTLLQKALSAPEASDWMLLLEFDLLRLEKRIDAILLTNRAILVLEFKVGARTFSAADRAQVEDYALDLHDFHAGSHSYPVVPILVCTHAPATCPTHFNLPSHSPSGTVLEANEDTLRILLLALHASIPQQPKALDVTAWLAAPYRPVPTIIEAATRLYVHHGVQDIAATRAEAKNLLQTTAAIKRVVESVRVRGQHTVVFVTGIPGAGKTLCGLNVVFDALQRDGAAFVSGNAPLVAVLREALARDESVRKGLPVRTTRHHTAAALQNVHRWLEHYVVHPEEVPAEHIIVFDEAQRAWDEAKAIAGSHRRRSRLTRSEPAHNLEIMARHGDWAVIVALIGNGQEINTGEAGLGEWGRVIEASNGSWQAVAAPQTVGTGPSVLRLADGPREWLTFDPDLDLSVPIRSIRDSRAAPWVDAVVAGEETQARDIAGEADALPFFITRDLALARSALRGFARGLRRAGLVCSAGAKRLRTEGLGTQVSGPDETVAWFLSRWPDVRASDALEVCATEYSCQGLELDVVGLAWGGDLIREEGGWEPRAFSGTRWERVHNPDGRRFVMNTYRVLMTRARYETVIWVPAGSDEGDSFFDRTRPAAEMDEIANYLLDCGARTLDAKMVSAQTSV